MLSARDASAPLISADSPTAAEQSALVQRRNEFRKNHAGATMIVYPVQIGDATDTESAARIARLLDRLSIGNISKVAPATVLPLRSGSAGAATPVWDLARSFRDHLRQNPAPADYALFINYTFDPTSQAWTVLQYVVCTANGDWVIVEREDLRSPKYQMVVNNVKSDCDEWIVCWLQRSSSYPATPNVAVMER